MESGNDAQLVGKGFQPEANRLRGNIHIRAAYSRYIRQSFLDSHYGRLSLLLESSKYSYVKQIGLLTIHAGYFVWVCVSKFNLY